ncbi:hypothetical protein FQA39_LY01470 [Lamprigera yunnana]|nr:hypothetical protein FQA39_LY01470 [Lamprigera yunnana]
MSEFLEMMQSADGPAKEEDVNIPLNCIATNSLESSSVFEVVANDVVTDVSPVYQDHVLLNEFNICYPSAATNLEAVAELASSLLFLGLNYVCGPKAPWINDEKKAAINYF